MLLHGKITTFGPVRVFVKRKPLDYHVIAKCDVCRREVTEIVVSKHIGEEALAVTRKRVETVAIAHRHSLSALGPGGR